MYKNFSRNLLASIIPMYACACLAIVAYLAHFPLHSTKFDSYIPELTGSTLLPDFSAIEQSPERKRAFIGMLLPLIEEKNRALLTTRTVIIELQQQLAAGTPLNNKQNKLVEQLREHYGVSHETYPETAKAIEILLLRVDIIPPSMVLAQAAVESGWGTSRFAAEGHSLFGQWCYTPGCGMVPARRPAGARHEVRTFSSVEDALNAYYTNINTHNAYRNLRKLRAQLREQEDTFTGLALITGLERYSGRGAVYINELRTMIRANDLENLEAPEMNLASQP